VSDQPAQPQPEPAAEQTPEQKPTETVDFWKAKAREQETRAKANADAAKRLADIEAAQLSESEKAAKRIGELETSLTDREKSLLRMQVAIDKGLPKELVGRLQGGTAEELAADADTLLELVKADNSPRTPRPDPSQGVRSQGGVAASPADEFATFITGQLNR
jgi:hypothetical protein